VFNVNWGGDPVSWGEGKWFLVSTLPVEEICEFLKDGEFKKDSQ
jgi:hypothetical protein